jgi:hypothetical protein
MRFNAHIRPRGAIRNACSRVFGAVQVLWAAPLSVLGLPLWLIALSQGAAQASMRWSASRHAPMLLLSAHSPCIAWLLARHPMGPMQAMAVGSVVLARDAQALRQCMAHECVHVRQAMRWGPLFPLVYAGSSVLAWWRGGCAYADNCFERQAYGQAGVAHPP